jgi:hypothetical protein
MPFGAQDKLALSVGFDYIVRTWGAACFAPTSTGREGCQLRLRSVGGATRLGLGAAFFVLRGLGLGMGGGLQSWIGEEGVD